MRWLHFIFLAYVMLGLQIGFGGFTPAGGSPLNFVLIAAVFIAINAQRDPALIACFILGLLHDLVGSGPIGLYALAYSCVALLVAGADRSMSVEHPFTHFFVTLFGAVVVSIIFKIVNAWHGISTSIWTDLLSGFYTAVLALAVLWFLTRLRRSFKFRSNVGR